MQLVEAFARVAVLPRSSEEDQVRRRAFRVIHAEMEGIASRLAWKWREPADAWDDIVQKKLLKIFRAGLPPSAGECGTDDQVRGYLTVILLNQRRDEHDREELRREHEVPLATTLETAAGPQDRDILKTRGSEEHRPETLLLAGEAGRRVMRMQSLAEGERLEDAIRRILLQEAPDLEDAARETLLQAMVAFARHGMTGHDSRGGILMSLLEGDPEADALLEASVLAFARLVARTVASRKAQVRREMPSTLRDMIRLWAQQADVRALVDEMPPDPKDAPQDEDRRFGVLRARLYKRFERARSYLEEAVVSMPSQPGMDGGTQAEILHRMINLLKFRTTAEPLPMGQKDATGPSPDQMEDATGWNDSERGAR